MAFFPHGLGRKRYSLICLLSWQETDYLGLECHDVGEGGALLFAFKETPPSWSHAYFDMLQDTNMRSSPSLAPNMVITVEPGM
jgi:Xaa-Pro dipeptidase